MRRVLVSLLVQNEKTVQVIKQEQSATCHKYTTLAHLFLVILCLERRVVDSTVDYTGDQRAPSNDL